jgi:indolepyruvate ferredoxin oxidoreductase beta subunit
MVEMILCGRGGQGIVFLTKLIGRVLTTKGSDVISSETHGMAVRGGSINSHLRVGPFSSPLIRPGHADILVSLEPTETPNNIHFLKSGGMLVENSAQPSEDGLRRIDATALARKIGRAQLENVVLLGYACTLDMFPVTPDEVKAALADDPRENVRVMNLKAIEEGLNAGRD